LSGAVVRLPSGRTGIIHGDDGYDVTFNEQSLVVGLGHGDLGIGLRVSYGIFVVTGAKVPTAINVMPALGQAEKIEDGENMTSGRVSQFGGV